MVLVRFIDRQANKWEVRVVCTRRKVPSIQVYILKSLKTQKLYKGYTRNIKLRLREHNSGKTRSIKSDRPWRVVYQECHDNLRDAIDRERYLKTSAGRRWIKKNLKL